MSTHTTTSTNAPGNDATSTVDHAHTHEHANFFKLPQGARRAILAAMLGTLVEWYDYALYGAAASLVIGPLFFSELDTAQTVASFATFAVGFIARPLGGLMIAHLGDRHGRKPAMLVNIRRG